MSMTFTSTTGHVITDWVTMPFNPWKDSILNEEWCMTLPPHFEIVSVDANSGIITIRDNSVS